MQTHVLPSLFCLSHLPFSFCHAHGRGLLTSGSPSSQSLGPSLCVHPNPMASTDLSDAMAGMLDVQETTISGGGAGGSPCLMVGWADRQCCLHKKRTSKTMGLLGRTGRQDCILLNETGMTCLAWLWLENTGRKERELLPPAHSLPSPLLPHSFLWRRRKEAS